MFNRIRLAAASAILAAMAVAAGPAIAQQNPDRLRESHGDWEVRCQDETDNACYMMQLIEDDSGAPLLLMRLRKLPDPVEASGNVFTVEAELFTRLGFLLPAGISMQIDAEEPNRIPFERCLPNGCGSLPLFTNEMINALKAGGVARFTMLVNPGEEDVADISLSGFTAAYDSL